MLFETKKQATDSSEKYRNKGISEDSKNVVSDDLRYLLASPDELMKALKSQNKYGGL